MCVCLLETPLRVQLPACWACTRPALERCLPGWLCHCVSVRCTTAGFPDHSTADFWGQITLLVGSCSVSCRTLEAALASTHWTPAAPPPTALLWPHCGVTGLAGGCLTFPFGGLPFHSLSGIFFFPPLVFVYLAAPAPALSCGMRILRCGCEI